MNYQEVINKLEAERSRIDEAVAALKAINSNGHVKESTKVTTATAVVQYLEKIERPARAMEVWRAIKEMGMDRKRTSVGTTLTWLARHDQIKRLEEGLFQAK